jgi:hypothetical protein
MGMMTQNEISPQLDVIAALPDQRRSRVRAEFETGVQTQDKKVDITSNCLDAVAHCFVLEDRRATSSTACGKFTLLAES